MVGGRGQPTGVPLRGPRVSDARLQDEAHPPLRVTKKESPFDVYVWEQMEREGPYETDR